MIELKVIDQERDQVIVRGDEPYRTETTVTDVGNLILHVYRGANIDKAHEPVGAYFGHRNDNESWRVE